VLLKFGGCPLSRVERAEIRCPKWAIAVNLVADIRQKRNGVRRCRIGIAL